MITQTGFTHSPSKPAILLIAPGPKYNPVQFYQERMTVLSHSYQGVILTSSPTPGHNTVGNFTLIAKKFYKNKFIETISYLWACYKLPKRLEKLNHKIDLIVTYDPLRSGLIGVFLKMRLNAKLAVEINGIYDDPANYLDIKNKFIAKFKSWTFVRVEKLVISHADGIKLLFKGQVDNFLKGITKQPIKRHFSNLVTIAPFLATSSDAEQKRILFVGYPHFLKGVDILIEAFSRLSKRFPEWELTIIGYYPDPLIIETSLADRPNIVYHPPVPEAEIPAHMAAHSILVLPSRAEAMGRVLVEAMAVGCARVGSNQGGIPTVIRDGIDGLLFEKGNPEDLAACLAKLMDSRDLRERLGKAARERVSKEFRKEQYFERVHSFYQDIIEGTATKTT